MCKNLQALAATVNVTVGSNGMNLPLSMHMLNFPTQKRAIGPFRNPIFSHSLTYMNTFSKRNFPIDSREFPSANFISTNIFIEGDHESINLYFL